MCGKLDTMTVPPAVHPHTSLTWINLATRRVFATVANLARKAMVKVRALVAEGGLRVWLATGVYRDELAEAEWVK
jgi:hypothetical protein